jgi:hypothetical protein
VKETRILTYQFTKANFRNTRPKSETTSKSSSNLNCTLSASKTSWTTLKRSSKRICKRGRTPKRPASRSISSEKRSRSATLILSNLNVKSPITNNKRCKWLRACMNLKSLTETNRLQRTSRLMLALANGRSKKVLLKGSRFRTAMIYNATTTSIFLIVERRKGCSLTVRRA